MGRRRVYAWAIWINLCLALVLGGCVSQERPQTPSAPTPAPAPQTDERPAAPQPPLRVGLTPNYPPVIFKAEGHLTGLEVDLAHGLNEELGRPIELVELYFPVLFDSYEYRQDSAGAGLHRGGFGVTKGWRLTHGEGVLSVLGSSTCFLGLMASVLLMATGRRV